VPSSTSSPGLIALATTPAASTSVTNSIVIGNSTIMQFPKITTTASAANAFLDNGNANNLLRSTSSVRFKKNITDVPQSRIDAIKALRLVEFTSTCQDDDPKVRHIGMIAEELAEIDPDLVFWGYDYEQDYYQKPIGDPPRGWTTLKEGAIKKPDGIMYERLLLLKVAALEQEIERLKARL
jgi:hypothetical protein